MSIPEWLPVMSDLQVLGEGKVRPSVQAGPGCGLPVDRSYEGPLGVVRTNEVLRRLSGATAHGHQQIHFANIDF